MTDKNQTQLMIVALTVAVMLLAFGGTADRQEQERQHVEYCEMVQIWHDSGGAYGWPPYRGEAVSCDNLEAGFGSQPIYPKPRIEP